MLYIKIGDEESGIRRAKTDIEKLFFGVKLKGTEEEKLMIEKIEHGTWNDTASYIDRFGFKLYFSEMSTGCKAALCILNCKEEEIDIAECGLNARDIIISLIKEGKIIINYLDAPICDYSKEQEIDVCVDGYRFRKMDRLNYYLSEERPFAPDFSRQGIEKV